MHRLYLWPGPACEPPPRPCCWPCSSLRLPPTLQQAQHYAVCKETTIRCTCRHACSRTTAGLVEDFEHVEGQATNVGQTDVNGCVRRCVDAKHKLTHVLLLMHAARLQACLQLPPDSQMLWHKPCAQLTSACLQAEVGEAAKPLPVSVSGSPSGSASPQPSNKRAAAEPAAALTCTSTIAAFGLFADMLQQLPYCSCNGSCLVTQSEQSLNLRQPFVQLFTTPKSSVGKCPEAKAAQQALLSETCLTVATASHANNCS